MKYLRRFNESKKTKIEDLQEFCAENLAYLIDNKFIITVGIGYPDKFVKEIHIKKYDNSRFDWNDVKYDFIPFMEELLKSIHYQKQKLKIKQE